MLGTGMSEGKHEVNPTRVWDQTVKGTVCYTEKSGLGRVGKK